MPYIISLEFEVRDGKKAKSSITLYLYSLGGESVAELDAIAVTALPVLRNIIYGGIGACRIGFHADLADLLGDFPSLATPEPFADVEEGALFAWGVEDEFEPTKQRIPTFDESCLVPGKRVVDVTNLQVIPFIEMMTDYIETPIDTYNFVNSKGFRLRSLENGSENFRSRKSNRKRRRP